MTIERHRRDRPLRIVMLIPYDLEYQPFTIRTAMFAKELARRGHEVRIFYRQVRNSRRWQSVKVHGGFPEGCQVSVQPSLFRPSGWRAVVEAVQDADVVHFQKSAVTSSLIALVLGRWFGKPIHQDWDDLESAYWWQEANDAVRDTGRLGRRARKIFLAGGAALVKGSLERVIPKLVDTMGGASMYLRRKSVEWGCDPSAVFPARVGVDAERFRPERRDEALRQRLGLVGPTVLFAGTFDAHPDLIFFAESLRALFRHAPETQCLVVGGGPARTHLFELVRSEAPSGSLVMTQDFVPFEEMPRYVASADIAALPFRDTPVYRSKSSLTLLESMASGLAIVTHDVGDVGWMLGDGGVIAAAGDPEAFGRDLAALARDPARRTQLGSRARSRATERFGWPETVDYLEEAYYRCAKRRMS